PRHADNSQEGQIASVLSADRTTEAPDQCSARMCESPWWPRLALDTDAEGRSMIHYHVLAEVAAEHRRALVAEGTARRLARHARHASRPRSALRARSAGTAPQDATSYDVV